MAIKWIDEYSVEIQEIDMQHKKIIEYINEIYEAIYNSLSQKELLEKIHTLLVFSKNHFDTEEGYFYKLNYPLREEHEKEHRDLEIKLKSFLGDIRQEDRYLENMTKFLDFLETWLIDHLMYQDKKYIAFFHQNGLK